MTDTNCGGCAKPTKTGFVCQGCLDKLETALTCMPWLFEELAIAISKQTRFVTEDAKVAASGVPALSFNPVATEARKRLADALGRWQANLADALGQPVRFTNALGDAGWLYFNLKRLRTYDQAGELFGEIIDARQAATEAIDRPPERSYLGECGMNLKDDEVCSAILWGVDTEDIAKCKACGTEWGSELRLKQIREQALNGMHDRIMTATQAASTIVACEIGTDTNIVRVTDRIRKWAEQPRNPNKAPMLLKRTELRTAGGRLRPGYKLGDIITIINRLDERRAANTKRKAG